MLTCVLSHPHWGLATFTATKFFGVGKQPQQAQQQQGAGSAGSIPQAQVPGQAATANAVPTHAVPAWPLGIPLAMHVHLSTSPTGDVFSSKWTSGYRKDQDAELPSLVWSNITFGDWNEKRVADFTVNLPEVRGAIHVLCGHGLRCVNINIGAVS